MENLLRVPKPTYEEIEHLISALPSFLIGLSEKNKIVFWNLMAEKVFGAKANDVVGRPLDKCGVVCDWDKIFNGISQSRSKGQTIRLDDIGFHRPGIEKGYIGITIQPFIGDDKRIWRTAIMGADITDRKKLELHLQQSHKMEAIGQLAAGIAHEINTPTQFVGDNTRFFQDAFDDLLKIINIYREILDVAKLEHLSKERIMATEERIKDLDLDYLEEEIPIAIRHTLKGVGRIAKIVQAMKIFAHPGGEEKEPVDINSEIEKTITISRNEWKYIAELETDFDQSLSLVPCFQAELNQVILNLIVNAAHAIAEANKDSLDEVGRISIETRREGNWAKIYISDTGAGIPQEIRHKIFDLFFTTKDPGKGTGQGLAISHSVIVEKHKGKIEMESQEGKGTTFIISLPLSSESEQNEKHNKTANSVCR
ncbi:MAG: ATP-binding protein [Desulfobacterales bacterium]|jgi:signal transduction histidine kinase